MYTRMKHIATALMECAEDTGYRYEFLESILEEELQELIDEDELTIETVTKTVDYVIAVAYENDWDDFEKVS